MSISPISDGVTNALHLAINGLDARGRAITANVANLETPGYHAAEVDFETSLRAALASGDGSDAQVETSTSLAATRINGNNVNIDFELMAGDENQLRQRLTVQALNAKYALLRTAISGR
ncbi:MAG: flagellar biosynthesis protein FlgB [Actinomycetota bacterium]|nr:flagellar biosynthesis protein FlgB [Actinomycetota bacterium]